MAEDYVFRPWAPSAFGRGLARPVISAAAASSGILVSTPTDGTTRSSSTLGSLGTAWTDDITVGASEQIKYDVRISAQVSTGRMYMAVAVDGTIVDRRQLYSGAGAVETNASLHGVHDPGGAGTYTVEVYLASDAAATVTVNSVVDTTISTSLTYQRDSLSQMILEPVTVA